MLYDENEYTKKQIIAGYLMSGVPLLFATYMSIFGFRQIADKKVENPDNLIKGCMYYNSTITDKNNNTKITFYVDGIFGDTLKSTPNIFYKTIRNRGFNNLYEFEKFISSNGKRVCYGVSYVEIDFILFKKVFIYDYHGINHDNKYLNQTINVE